jgi:hypothetical protein
VSIDLLVLWVIQDKGDVWVFLWANQFLVIIVDTRSLNMDELLAWSLQVQDVKVIKEISIEAPKHNDSSTHK